MNGHVHATISYFLKMFCENIREENEKEFLLIPEPIVRCQLFLTTNKL